MHDTMQVTTKVDRPATEQERELAEALMKAITADLAMCGVAINPSRRSMIYSSAVDVLRARPLEATHQDNPARESRETTAAATEGARDEVMEAAFDGQLGVSNALRMETIRLRAQVAQLNAELAMFKAGTRGGC